MTTAHLADGPSELLIGAGARLVALTGTISDWDAPGLGVWDVRALVGHTLRAFITVEQYLATTPPDTEVTLPSAAAYYRAALGAGGDHGAVAQRGRDAGRALGDQPARAVAEVVGRVGALISTADPMTVVALPWGAMRLGEYVRTRLTEVVVHTSDLAAALGVAPPATAEELAAVTAIAIELAIAAGHGDGVLRALTGRGALPAGFSVV
jgi:uncharacterized protein (TIGR03083 family)